MAESYKRLHCTSSHFFSSMIAHCWASLNDPIRGQSSIRAGRFAFQFLQLKTYFFRAHSCNSGIEIRFFLYPSNCSVYLHLLPLRYEKNAAAGRPAMEEFLFRVGKYCLFRLSRATRRTYAGTTGGGRLLCVLLQTNLCWPNSQSSH